VQITGRTIDIHTIPVDQGNTARTEIRVDSTSIRGGEIGLPNGLAGCGVERLYAFRIAFAMKDDHSVTDDCGSSISLSDGIAPQ
jgi:hypothetical protein